MEVDWRIFSDLLILRIRSQEAHKGMTHCTLDSCHNNGLSNLGKILDGLKKAQEICLIRPKLFEYKGLERH